MPKRGGLGRGLDALIPDRQSEKQKKEKSKPTTVKKSPASKTVERDTKEKSTQKSGSGRKKAVSQAEEEKKPKSAKKTSYDIIEETDLLMAEYDNQNDAEESADRESDLYNKEETPSESEIGSKPDDAVDETAQDTETIKKEFDTVPDGSEVVNMKISMVEPNRDQPRKYFDDAAIDELADSIRQFGIIQPLLVQKTDDYYQIIAGERRWRAASRAGLKEVPVIIRNFSNQEAVEVALIENIQREDLNPIEEAKAYHRLVTEYHLSQEEVAGRVSKSRSAVTNSMRLLRLDEEIQTMVETGVLSEGHARTLLSVPAADVQKRLASQVVKEGLSVRQTEKLVRDLMMPGRKREKKEDSSREAMLNSLSEQLQNALGTKVSIRQTNRKKGKIEIEYYSDEELDRIYELLRSLR